MQYLVISTKCSEATVQDMRPHVQANMKGERSKVRKLHASVTTEREWKLSASVSRKTMLIEMPINRKKIRLKAKVVKWYILFDVVPSAELGLEDIVQTFYE